MAQRFFLALLFLVHHRAQAGAAAAAAAAVAAAGGEGSGSSASCQAPVTNTTAALQLIAAGATRQLIVHHQGLGVAGATAIARALRASPASITRLDLDGNAIGDAGAIAIAAALPSTSIRELCVTRSLFTSAVSFFY